MAYDIQLSLSCPQRQAPIFTMWNPHQQKQLSSMLCIDIILLILLLLILINYIITHNTNTSIYIISAGGFKRNKQILWAFKLGNWKYLGPSSWKLGFPPLKRPVASTNSSQLALTKLWTAFLWKFYKLKSHSQSHKYSSQKYHA